MKETLEEIEQIIDWFREQHDPGLHDVIHAYQRLVGALYMLETYRVEYKRKHDAIIFNLVQEKTSVARATNEADVKVPQLYMLRRIMDAAYNNSDAMRTIISAKKQELSNSYT